MVEKSIKQILDEIFKNKRSLIVTLPSEIKWKDYERERRKAANYKHTLKFKVHNFPKGIHEGDKCYVVYNGLIKGWMEIVGFAEETCMATNKKWDGKYIQRSGPFHYLQETIPYKGFQGFRYFDLNEYKQEKGIE